jgi:predicted neuraminidase
MESRAARAFWLLAIGLAVWSGLHRALGVPPPSTFDRAEGPAPPPLDASSAPHGFVSSGAMPMAHSATAVELGDGRLRAFWYGGSREGAKDVAIYSAVFDPARASWSAEEVAVARREARDELGRYLRKLGNPVAFRDRRGRLWLFYVSVSFGGWSGSAVNFKTSDDEGVSWSRSRRLVTSPLLNVSTLVKGPALDYADGTLGLPVYHELLGKFGELLRIDTDGRLLDKTRLSWGRSSLQPVIVPLTKHEAVGFLRASGSSPHRILTLRTEDAGRSWSELAPTSLPNPDAAISALRAGRQILLVFNDSERNRGNLKIARSRDGGKTFEEVGPVPVPGAPPEAPADFSYPWLLQTGAGDVHLLYTWNRERIAHVWFRR